MGWLILIAAIVVLFPIGWFVSKDLYKDLIAWLALAISVTVVVAIVWYLVTGASLLPLHPFPRSAGG